MACFWGLSAESLPRIVRSACARWSLASVPALPNTTLNVKISKG